MDRVSIKDPANGNNNLIAGMTLSDRRKAKRLLINDLELIDQNTRNLKKIFK
jgi:hypothetical protein